MEFIGSLEGITRDVLTGKTTISFSLDDRLGNIQSEAAKLEGKKLRVTAKAYHKRRSKDANALLWECLEQIAEALNTDRWSVYLEMLKRYGKATYILVKDAAVDAVREAWRECEVVGKTEVHGEPCTQLLCFFGSSMYDSKEFSRLLDGVMSEMREMGLEPPPSEEMEAALKLCEGRKKNE